MVSLFLTLLPVLIVGTYVYVAVKIAKDSKRLKELEKRIENLEKGEK